MESELDSHDEPLPETIPLSQEQRDFWEESPLISTLLPVKFPSKASLTHLTAECAICQSREGLETRGSVAFVTEQVLNVRLLSWCSKCNVFTPSVSRVRSTDGFSMQMEMEKDGVWYKRVYLQPRSRALLRKVGDWLRALWRPDSPQR